MLLSELYRRYLRAADHPMKGRIVGLLDKMLVPHKGIATETEYGVHMWLHPHRSWERHLLAGGRYHSGMCAFMQSNIRQGETVAVAGVSFGQQTIIASRAAGPNGKVVAVDPHPAALIRACNNLALNDLPDNVFLVGAALSDGPSILSLSSASTDHVGAGSFIKPPEKHPYRIPSETLEVIITRLRIPSLDVLFLDVIGYELPILATLKAPFLPRLVTVAIHPWVCQQLNLTLKDYQEALGRLGYKCTSLEGEAVTQANELRECQLVGTREGQAVWLPPDKSVPTGVWM